MVTGRKPFVVESPLAVVRMHMDEVPVAPRTLAPERGLSVQLDAVIMRVLEKDPAARYQAASAFAEALRGTPEGRDLPAPSGAKPKGTPGRWGRRVVGLALLGMLGAIALVGTSHLRDGKGRALWKRADRERVVTKLEHAVEVARKSIDEMQAELAGPPEAPSTPAAKDDDDAEGPEDADSEAETPGSRLEKTPPVEAKAARRPPRIEDARRDLAAGRADEAIVALYALRKQTPRSATVALLLGHAYFRKVWRTDALREYALALSYRPQLRTDRLLVRNLVAALDDPTHRRARGLILARIGPAALGELRRAARSSTSPKVEARAARLANVLAAKRGKRR